MQAKTNIPGAGKGKVISNKGDGVAAQQFQLRLGKNTTVPLTLGFTKSNELFVGRLAMLGFCLLYTSPSPRDRQKSRMPSSA